MVPVSSLMHARMLQQPGSCFAAAELVISQLNGYIVRKIRRNLVHPRLQIPQVEDQPQHSLVRRLACRHKANGKHQQHPLPDQQTFIRLHAVQPGQQRRGFIGAGLQLVACVVCKISRPAFRGVHLLPGGVCLRIKQKVFIQNRRKVAEIGKVFQHLNIPVCVLPQYAGTVEVCSLDLGSDVCEYFILIFQVVGRHGHAALHILQFISLKALCRKLHQHKGKACSQQHDHSKKERSIARHHTRALNPLTHVPASFQSGTLPAAQSSP